MRKVLSLAIIATLFLFASCSSGDDLIGNWVKKDDFSGVPRNNAVTFTIGNYAYVGCGYDGEDRLNSFKKFDLTSETWTSVESPGDLFKVRQNAVAFSANGKGYVGTGFNGDYTRYDDFWEFDPATETWTQSATFIGGVREGSVAFSTDTYGVVGAGYGDLDEADKKYLNDYYKFDGTSWTSLGTHGNKVREASSFVIGDYAYICTGTLNTGGLLNKIYKFDIAAGTWVSQEVEDQIEILDEDYDNEDVMRSNAVAFVINNKAYIATGSYGSSLKRDVWEYNPATDDWDEKEELEYEVSARQNAVAFSNADNTKAYIATGSSGTRYLDDTWEFEPNVEEDDIDNY
jgi:N-acetylneuraminic acid mutarotase